MVQTTIQVLSTISQREVAPIPNRNLVQHGSMPFQDYKQFIEFCNQFSIEDRAKLAEFYIHNITLIDMNILDPNVRLGDT